MNPRLFFLLAAALLAAVPGYTQIVITETYTYPVVSPSGNIPDGISSLSFNEVVSGSQIGNLTDVMVTLNLSGAPIANGWAGDMFVSLNRDLGSQTAILLNQAGATASNLAGYGAIGWNVTLQTGAANGDIHFATPTSPSTIVTGTWQPDGRLNPTSTSRPAGLDVFNGGTGNATWYLNVADLSPGGSMTLTSWSLTLKGTSPVPEPAESVFLFSLGLGVFSIVRRLSRPKPDADPFSRS